jgi:hypothetical protein
MIMKKEGALLGRPLFFGLLQDQEKDIPGCEFRWEI